MSINMYVSASQRQASSVSNMCKQQVQGYEQLQKAMTDFTLNSPFLTGKAYDSAKNYFSSVLYPLAQAGILLSEAVERAVKKFPETYVAQVDSGDLIQAELEIKIREVNSLLVQAEGIQRNLMLLNVPHLDGMRTAQLSANSTLIHMYGGVKKKLEEKLQKLIAFNSSSPSIFSEIASLQQAVNQGLAQTKTAWNASSGTFTVPNTEALSWTKGIQEKWQDYVKRHEPKIEVRAEKVNKGSVGEHTHYNVYVDGVYDEDKTKELRWMFDKESFKESAHFIGDFVFINDIYQSVTGEDWLSGEEGSRTAAAGMLVLSVLPTKKLENIAKALKGGKKTLKGVELTEKEEKVLKEAGVLDKFKNVEKASETNNLKINQNAKSGTRSTGKGSKIEDISKLTTEDIPTAKSGKFNDFFNSLSSAELDELWKDKKIRKKIERQLREPGGLHEWHLVSRAPQFKFWDTSAEKIKDLRTAISDVKFVNPKGVHGGLGSTKAHNELLAIIDTSNDYNTFIRRLNNWAHYRLEGGISSLPEGLKLK
ncbi:T7SS effector LXG polymorphic toxin [Bacillus paramycoides]|uniref:T7SS effector LXG polymorphic toxin n=1 Tax=Bacillus paramycoides TaxID=2026194 RepID=UPI0040580F70